MELFSHEEEETLPSATWTGLNGFMIKWSKLDREDRYRMIPLICGIRKTNTTKTTLTDTEKRWVVARGRAWEVGGQMGEGAQKVPTSSYKIHESWGGMSTWSLQLIILQHIFESG